MNIVIMLKVLCKSSTYKDESNILSKIGDFTENRFYNCIHTVDGYLFFTDNNLREIPLLINSYQFKKMFEVVKT